MRSPKKKNIKGVIDRFEGGSAVLLLEHLDGISLLLPAEVLPEDAREGSVVELSIRARPDKTLKARREVGEMIERLKRRRID